MKYPIAAACLVALSASEIITFIDPDSRWEYDWTDQKLYNGVVKFRNVLSFVTKTIYIPDGDIISWDKYHYFHFEVDVASAEGTPANDYYYISVVGNNSSNCSFSAEGFTETDTQHVHLYFKDLMMGCWNSGTIKTIQVTLAGMSDEVDGNWLGPEFTNFRGYMSDS